MSIEKVVGTVESYKRIYLEAMKQISAVKNDSGINQQGKEKRIGDVVKRYGAQVDAAADRVLEEIERTQGEIRAERQKAIRQGMSRAAEVELVQKGVRSGEFKASYVADLIEIYKEDPIMMSAIKAAVVAKGSKASEAVKNLVAGVPEDRTDDIIKGLRKASERIISAPKLTDTWVADDWSAGLWANGTSIDSLITFLLGLDGVEQVKEESEAQAAVDAQALHKIFTDHNTGIKFGNN